MNSKIFSTILAGTALSLAAGSALAAAKAPPPADLKYAITATQKGMSLDGESNVKWRVDGGRYTLSSESRASILGRIQENRSEGSVGDDGLAPEKFTEKRFRKDPYSVTFDREAKAIRFTEGTKVFAIKGGEQDRASAPWQLAALGRATPSKFVAGSEWRMIVAGRRDAEPWVFKVTRTEKLRTPMGQLDAVHLVREPSADSKEQQVDIWLAPAHEWYPVKVRFSDHDGEDVVEQTIAKITMK
ncbi:DUF3108 domain-containing protein [Massilia cavernae]|uniref:DUF3108 domain-containing protein n=1 Tax=Massilia cavernae TaxID=2320864 RepID=A0A418XFS7_9BURK|nr:DUF3108 domain-containing protein [Massilia cavernae]RJG11311.1 DUF3108 domain-containing protein [Massilia cavernae]